MMKDILFSVKQQKTELKLFAACLLLAYLLNILSIVAYGTEWSELWTQSFWMLLIGGGLYGLSVVVRLLWFVYENRPRRDRGGH